MKYSKYYNTHKEWSKENIKKRRTYQRKYINNPKVKKKRIKYIREWILKNKDKVALYRKKYKQTEKAKNYRRKYQKEWLRKLRLDVLRHYSKGRPSCKCCKEKEIKFLSIDHINGGGNEHRRKDKIINLAKWVKDNNYPKGFQVLCFNCNMAKGMYKICPHKMI